MSLSPDDVQHYRRHGYLPGKPILSAPEAERFRDGCMKSCRTEDKDGVHRQASNRVKPYLLYQWASDLIRHPKILDAVETLIGPNILAFHTTVWFKEGRTPNFVPWHQDATYFGLAPFEHVTAWSALTASNPNNGCLQVLPGTHTNGQRGHKDQRDERAMLSRGQTVTDLIDDSQATNLILSPGDVSFHHTLLMHRSGPNASDAPRVGVGVSYIPTHVAHIGQTRLSATLVRGEDRFGNFDPEPEPTSDDSPEAIAAHAEALGRFWVASESIPEMAFVH
jgi:ectoine hydroxylase-related dioxygenase (phytanoyl-CoA dioxygenase family)